MVIDVVIVLKSHATDVRHAVIQKWSVLNLSPYSVTDVRREATPRESAKHR
jgi:hypothetical protein